VTLHVLYLDIYNACSIYVA